MAVVARFVGSALRSADLASRASRRPGPRLPLADGPGAGETAGDEATDAAGWPRLWAHPQPVVGRRPRGANLRAAPSRGRTARRRRPRLARRRSRRCRLAQRNLRPRCLARRCRAFASTEAFQWPADQAPFDVAQGVVSGVEPREPARRRLAAGGLRAGCADRARAGNDPKPGVVKPSAPLSTSECEHLDLVHERRARSDHKSLLARLLPGVEAAASVG